MKVITVTRSARPTTTALVNEPPKLHKVNESTVTVAVPYVLETKDMFLTFSKQEVLTLLSYFADYDKGQDDFFNKLKGNGNITPDDSGSDGSLV